MSGEDGETERFFQIRVSSPLASSCVAGAENPQCYPNNVCLLEMICGLGIMEVQSCQKNTSFPLKRKSSADMNKGPL